MMHARVLQQGVKRLCMPACTSLVEQKDCVFAHVSPPVRQQSSNDTGIMIAQLARPRQCQCRCQLHLRVRAAVKAETRVSEGTLEQSSMAARSRRRRDATSQSLSHMRIDARVVQQQIDQRPVPMLSRPQQSRALLG